MEERAVPLHVSGPTALMHWFDEAEVLDAARTLAFVRPLVPYPGWTFDADWDNPDVAFRLRRDIWEFFNERKTQVSFIFNWYDGLRLNLFMGNDLSRQLFIAGCAEPNEFAFLSDILKPGMVFVDAGAHDGIYTLFASRRVGAAGVVWAFESSEREFSRLEQNVTLNQLANARLFRAALGDRNGEEDLAIAGYEHEGQNTLGAFSHSGVEVLRSESVRVRKLDDVVREANLTKVDVIKMDVEGAEYRLIEGSRQVLSRFRPVLLFEASDAALEKQGASRDKLLRLVSSFQYELFAFDRASGRPIPTNPSHFSDNMVAMPAESPLVPRFVAQDFPKDIEPVEANGSTRFNPAQAYWNQRSSLAQAHDRIRALSKAVNHNSDLWPYQWAQLMATVLDYAPDLILELGRGKGNSTCAFTEASNIRQSRTRVLSLCFTDDWERETAPRLRRVVPPSWFEPLQTIRADLLDFDYEKALSGVKRLLIFWDAHGFDIAECVLGKILPLAARMEHLVIMHDLSDTRYGSEEQLEYGEHGLWKGNNWSGPRLKLGIVDSSVEQSIAILDFATRNHITLDSADHSFHTALTSEQQTEMRSILGELFDTQAHWFYFSLNERAGPYKFPRYTRPAQQNEIQPSTNEIQPRTNDRKGVLASLLGRLRHPGGK